MKHFLVLTLILLSWKSHAVISCDKGAVAQDNPAYPAAKVYQTLICQERPQNRVLIKDLESLLFHRSFKLPVEKEGATFRLHVGTAGSFSLWRDLINLNLGRAYYEEEELAKSLSYWDNILPSSPYYPLATLQANYARFKLKDLKGIKKKLKVLKSYPLTGERKNELTLQEALYQLRKDKFSEAVKLVQNLEFQSVDLKELKQRIIAESLFGKYLKTYTSLMFPEKVETLKAITNAVESIRHEKRDENLVFLAAEAYWHTAVAYRIEDPELHKNVWHKQLEIADAWISPLVDRTIQEQKAYLSEEAYFFSIALLWEREFHEKALVRLKNLDVIYPLGIYREDAYQLLGDYYFDEQDFKAAVPHYRKLAQTGSESKAAYGVYKAAWSFYNSKDKWKSLRHFERLFEFYLGKDTKNDDNNELMKEARQDLLLVISEILHSEKAIEELKTFKISSSETIEMIRDLAKLYQRNGNYKDSTATWNHLLVNHLSHPEAPEWIILNAQDFYADGKREDISRQIKHHYGTWKQKHFSEKGDKLIASEWSKIILSLHREAKKSEDPLFWKATDLAYETYEELRPDGQEGEVWYFGAQKFQFQNDFWRSVEWFKRAGNIKSYEQADDSALSVLGLLNDKSGELSLLEDKSKVIEEYKKLASYSHWFFTRPSEKLKKQKELAHFLYSEALFFTGENEKARMFLADLFNHPDQNEELWNVYLSHNKRLYKVSAWNESFVLATTLQQTKLGKKKDKFKFLANIAQENAFQLAFEAEKETPVNLLNLRKWYESAFTLPEADMKVKLKSWHNYLLSFSSDEAEAFELKLKEFVSQWHGKSEPDAAASELHFNIYAKSLKLFEGAKLYYKKNPYLYLASQYTDNSELKESLLWDSLVLHATYHQWDKFEERVSEIERLKAERFSAPVYQIALARFHFLKGDFKEAWIRSKQIIALDKNQGSAWTTVNDLFTEGSQREEIMSFLAENEEALKEVVWIRPLWAYLKKDAFLSSADVSDLQAERAPANVKNEDTEVIRAFKEKLASMGTAYKLMSAKKEKLKAAVMSWIPATAAHAVCASPEITHEATKTLHELKEKPIESEQWPQFLAKLDEKVKELKSLREQELAACEKVKDDLLFIGNFRPASTPFSLETYAKEKDIIKLESKNENPVDQFFASLMSGARVQSESYAATEKDPARRIYFYTLLRLASNDVWNAYILLEELQKKKGWENHALYLKSLIAEKNGRKALAQKWDVKDQIAFTNLEQEFYSQR